MVLASELEPLVDERNSRDVTREEFNTEYKKKFRPFSQYEYTGGGFSVREVNSDVVDSIPKVNNAIDKDASWYREVVELRKKAGEYRVRKLL